MTSNVVFPERIIIYDGNKSVLLRVTVQMFNANHVPHRRRRHIYLESLSNPPKSQPTCFTGTLIHIDGTNKEKNLYRFINEFVNKAQSNHQLMIVHSIL